MPRVTVTEFTDPFSTWCWGAEPILRRIEEVYGDQVAFEYVMGGLAEDFEDFRDPATEVESGEEVPPHWLAASRRHGMPVDVTLWEEDPPESTYPSNVAYEAAAFQGRDLAHAYLRRMREAGAAEARNLGREAVLVDLAGEVGLDVEQFRADLGSERARAAFEEDLRTAREHGVTAFPTVLVEVGDERELLRGYRPFSTFEKLFAELAPDLEEREPRPVGELIEHYGRMATQEVAEIHELPVEEAEARLRDLEAEGRVVAVEAGNGYFWEPAD